MIFLPMSVIYFSGAIIMAFIGFKKKLSPLSICFVGVFWPVLLFSFMIVSAIDLIYKPKK